MSPLKVRKNSGKVRCPGIYLHQYHFADRAIYVEIDDIVSTPCRTFERIDDTLRTWIGFIGTNKGLERPPNSRIYSELTFQESYVKNEQDVLRCSYALWSSDLFSKNDDYIRRQIVYALLQVRYAYISELPLNASCATA